jgi:hypothetical protein
LDFFEETLDKSIVRQEGTYWETTEIDLRAKAPITAAVPFCLTQQLAVSDLRDSAATEAPREPSLDTVIAEQWRRTMDILSAHPHLRQGMKERMDVVTAWLVSQTPTAAPMARQATEGRLISSLLPTDRKRARESRKRRLNEGPATELSRDDLM